jgi:hypothetical protein
VAWHAAIKWQYRIGNAMADIEKAGAQNGSSIANNGGSVAWRNNWRHGVSGMAWRMAASRNSEALEIISSVSIIGVATAAINGSGQWRKAVAAAWQAAAAAAWRGMA